MKCTIVEEKKIETDVKKGRLLPVKIHGFEFAGGNHGCEKAEFHGKWKGKEKRKIDEGENRRKLKSRRIEI